MFWYITANDLEQVGSKLCRSVFSTVFPGLSILVICFTLRVFKRVSFYNFAEMHIAIMILIIKSCGEGRSELALR